MASTFNPNFKQNQEQKKWARAPAPVSPVSSTNINMPTNSINIPGSPAKQTDTSKMTMGEPVKNTAITPPKTDVAPVKTDTTGFKQLDTYNKWATLNTGNVTQADAVTAATNLKWAKFGDAAIAEAQKDPTYLDTRNTNIAKSMIWAGKTDDASIKSILEQDAWFTSATPEAQAATIAKIKERIWQIQWSTTTPTWEPVIPTDTWLPTAPTGQKGKYKDANGNYVDILWYGDLPPDVQQYIDWMSEADKKMLDMQWGNDANWKAEYVRQAKRAQEYAKKQRDLTIQIQDKEWNTLEIQSSQRLRDASQQIDNMKQNFAYLGTRGQPWISAVKLDAVSRVVADAEKKFAELKQIETNAAQIRELWLKIDTNQFEKQMADISDDLNMKVWTQIQNALNEFTAADLAWQMDDIDGVMQFKRSLLEKLDRNISGYTEWSLRQMQYVTEQYTKLADDAQKQITDWNKNKNTVNPEMSAVKWFYVDGNGTPLYDSTGNTIKTPEKPPLDPIYDKESGKLIMFSTDATWQVVADVKQVTTEATMSQQAVSGYAQLVNSGTIKLDDVPAAMRNQVVTQMTQWVETPTVVSTPEWNYTSATESQIQQWLQNWEQKNPDWTQPERWQCGEFVNDYLKAAWIANYNMFKDPINKKEALINSQQAKVWSIAVIDTWWQYWHVGIVKSVNPDGSIVIKDSNYNGDEKVGTNTIKNPKAILWYFDPTVGTTRTKPEETTSAAPTAAELALFEGWQANIGKWPWKLTEQRYNKIAEYMKTQPKSDKIPKLDDDQRVIFNNQLSSFRWNPVVKAFEDGMTQYSNIKSSLDNVSWPWDVAAIFQFMKTLDPTSVVRETEFNTAASTAWVMWQMKNAYTKLVNWERLTDEQRTAFWKLAKQFIINRWESYDRLYGDMERVINNMWIDKSYLPQRATDVFKESVKEQAPTNIFSWFKGRW